MKSFLERIKDKQEQKRLYQDFTLLDEPVRLSNVDMQSIMYAIRDHKIKLTEKYENGAYKGKKVNEVEWNKYLTKRREVLEEKYADDSEKIEAAMAAEIENKPKSEAERLANEEATADAMLSILPVFFTDPKSGERLFEKDSADHKEFVMIMRSTPEMIRIISENFVELQNKMDDLTDTVKNSSGGDASQNTNSDLE